MLSECLASRCAAVKEEHVASPRRIGAEDSETRAALLDAAQQLMLEEGYAAVTSRKVAAKAGLKPQLVHYYFRTMDDLFLALLKRGAEQNLERQATALESPRPLHELWKMVSDPHGTALVMEMAALANHRKAIRDQMAAYAERFRAIQAEVVSSALAKSSVDAGGLSPEALVVLMTGLSQVLVMEEAIGVTTGHAATRALVERTLDRLED
jgi:AcrR family transcriptional regulator